MHKENLPNNIRSNTIRRSKPQPLHRPRSKQTIKVLTPTQPSPHTRQRGNQHRQQQNRPPSKRVRQRHPENIAHTYQQDVHSNEMGEFVEGLTELRGHDLESWSDARGAEVHGAAVEGHEAEDGEFAPCWPVERVGGRMGGLRNVVDCVGGFVVF